MSKVNGWPLTFEGQMNSPFQMISLKLLGQLWPYFIFSPYYWENENLFKWLQSAGQDGCHAISKTVWKSSPESRKWTLKLRIKHPWPEAYQICSDDDSKLTFDISTKRSSWLPYSFTWEHYWKGNFLRTVWRLMYHIWHRYFIGQENGNILVEKKKLCMWKMFRYRFIL